MKNRVFFEVKLVCARVAQNHKCPSIARKYVFFKVDLVLTVSLYLIIQSNSFRRTSISIHIHVSQCSSEVQTFPSMGGASKRHQLYTFMYYMYISYTYICVYIHVHTIIRLVPHSSYLMPIIRPTALPWPISHTGFCC